MADKTQAEKLEALVRKAVECGFVLPNKSWDYKIQSDRIIILTSMAIGDDGYEEPGNWRVYTFEILFNHDFARSLFGNGPNCAYCGLPPHSMHPNPCPEGSNIWPYLWEHHLQQAVISDDPIGYMYGVVFGEV